VEPGTLFDVDDDLRLRGQLPLGPPGFSFPARPNILMFGDGSWISRRTDEQYGRFLSFCNENLLPGIPFVVVEIGAGMVLYC
jgi:hypothetical protein